jgi:Tol biopolymer transport system component
VVDGVEMAEYDGIGGLIFSSDARRLAYFAGRGGKQFVVVDGVEGREYGGICKYSLAFSPDSMRVGYAAKCGAKPDGDYMQIAANAITEVFDTQYGATHTAERGVKIRVVIDGVEGNEYEGISEEDIIFSPDSRRVAYCANRNAKWFVVVDGVENTGYDGVHGRPVFSPDSKHFAYVAQCGKKVQVVVDGMITDKEYKGSLKGSKLVFDSPSVLHSLMLRDGNVLLVEMKIRD